MNDRIHIDNLPGTDLGTLVRDFAVDNSITSLDIQKAKGTTTYSYTDEDVSIRYEERREDGIVARTVALVADDDVGVLNEASERGQVRCWGNLKVPDRRDIEEYAQSLRWTYSNGTYEPGEDSVTARFPSAQEGVEVLRWYMRIDTP